MFLPNLYITDWYINNYIQMFAIIDKNREFSCVKISANIVEIAQSYLVGLENKLSILVNYNVCVDEFEHDDIYIVKYTEFLDEKIVESKWVLDVDAIKSDNFDGNIFIMHGGDTDGVNDMDVIMNKYWYKTKMNLCRHMIFTVLGKSKPDVVMSDVVLSERELELLNIYKVDYSIYKRLIRDDSAEIPIQFKKKYDIFCKMDSTNTFESFDINDSYNIFVELYENTV